MALPPPDAKSSMMAPDGSGVTLERSFPRFADFVSDYASQLSLGGIFVPSSSPPPPATIVDLDFRLEDGYRLFLAVGEVVWVRALAAGGDLPAGAGVRFHALDERGRELILRVLEEHVAAGGAPFELEPLPPGASRALDAVTLPSVRPDGDRERDDILPSSPVHDSGEAVTERERDSALREARLDAEIDAAVGELALDTGAEVAAVEAPPSAEASAANHPQAEPETAGAEEPPVTSAPVTPAPVTPAPVTPVLAAEAPQLPDLDLRALEAAALEAAAMHDAQNAPNRDTLPSVDPEAVELPDTLASVEQEAVELPDTLASVEQEAVELPDTLASVEQEAVELPDIPASVEQEAVELPDIPASVEQEAVELPDMPASVELEAVEPADVGPPNAGSSDLGDPAFEAELPEIEWANAAPQPSAPAPSAAMGPAAVDAAPVVVTEAAIAQRFESPSATLEAPSAAGAFQAASEQPATLTTLASPATVPAMPVTEPVASDERAPMPPRRRRWLPLVAALMLVALAAVAIKLLPDWLAGGPSAPPAAPARRLADGSVRHPAVDAGTNAAHMGAPAGGGAGGAPPAGVPPVTVTSGGMPGLGASGAVAPGREAAAKTSPDAATGVDAAAASEAVTTGPPAAPVAQEARIVTSPPPLRGRAHSLLDIAWRESDDLTLLTLTGNGDLDPARVRVSKIGGDEPRVVIRIAGIDEPYRTGRENVDGRYMRAIRTGMHPETGELHVVLDLTSATVAVRAESTDPADPHNDRIRIILSRS